VEPLADPFAVTFACGRSARAIRVGYEAELADAVRRLGLPQARPSLVLIGGADGMSASELTALKPLFRDVLAPLVETRSAVVLDGGTDTGVMQLMGAARAERRASFPLVGVVTAALAALPGEPAAENAAPLDPDHTHFVLVPGFKWGDEGRWLARLGGMIAQGSGCVTLVVNGGEITRRDVGHSVAAGRPVVVAAGSGRTADALASALRGAATDENAAELAASGLLRAVDVADPKSLERTIDELFTNTGD
jgi:hypothetical protein